jgi:hypothetical protein
MKKYKYIWTIILFTIIFLLAGSKVLAVETPNFPACSNPQGTIIVSYNDGAHGIVGSTAHYSGSDKVYQLDTSTLQQCFCSADGQGIQTNWWKISSLEPEELQILKNEGWIYVPNGALWGLQETPYMAINSNYSCLGNSNNNGGTSGGSSGGSDGRSDGRSDGLGCGSHDCSGNSNSSQGQVLGASTSILNPTKGVLGLSSTGGTYLPFILAAVGLTTIALGLILQRKSSQN